LETLGKYASHGKGDDFEGKKKFFEKIRFLQIPIFNLKEQKRV
jgi:hypothetical protein